MRSIENLQSELSAKLEQVKQKGLLRKLTANKYKTDFCSNDYLGIAKDSNDFFKKEIRFESGATGSRLISGHSIEAEKAELEIAKYHGFEAALIFNSGYMANIGLCAAIAGRNDSFIVDEFVHASIIDGVSLSKATKFKFRHNDVVSLANKLKLAKGNKFVMAESLYSMDGDEAPLVQIAELCEQYNALLIVDEAHAIGVWGQDGQGLVNKYGLQNKVLACVYTYGKAFGLHGAAIAGSNVLINYLINFSRPFIYTTALPPYVYSQIQQVYKQLPSVNRQPLFDLIAYFKAKSKNIDGYDFVDSDTQIQGILVGNNEEVIALSEYLNNEGFFVKAIRPPTVPKGSERIRICLHVYNTTKQIDLLFDKLKSFKQ